MIPVSTKWSVYSETGVPAWAAAAVLVVVVVVLLRWLRHECGARPSWPARLLPATLVLVAVPAVLILWRPVVTRVRSFEHAARRLVVVDDTRSMATPLQPVGLTGRLDLVALWDGKPLAGRTLAPRALREALGAFRVSGRSIAAAVERAAAEAEQGLPPGPDAAGAVTDFSTLVAEVRGQTGGLVADVQAAAAALPEAAALTAVSEPLSAVEAAVAALPATVAADPAAISEPLAVFLSALTRLPPLLDAAQEAVDAAFVARDAAVAKRLAEAEARTRSDLAALATRSLPTDVPVVTAASNALVTDLYAMLAAAVADGVETSDLVLVSDGGHNGGNDDVILRRLMQRKVRLFGVPAGLTEQSGDAAVIDWRVPRVLVAGKPAVLVAEIKAPAAAACKVVLRAEGEAAPLATIESAADQGPRRTVAVTFKPPPAGRHILRLVVECTGDANPANDSALLVVDTVARSRPLLLIDDVPSWDGVWLAAAGDRQGIAVSQLHLAGEEPKRGGLSRAVPQSLLQWTRYSGVVLDGPVFAGFSGDDAAVLRQFVADKGGTLLLLAGEPNGYGAALAEAFGWEWPAGAAGSRQRVRIPAAAADEPCLRLSADGQQSSRLLETLPAAGAAWRVPRGDIVLLETEAGEPVCTLSFLGRGKVIHWGLRGMDRMREFDGARVIDRLLEGLVGELAAPLVTGQGEDKAAAFAFHPPLPRIGGRCLLIAAGAPPPVEAAGAAVPAARSDAGGTMFPLSVTSAAVPVTIDGQRVTLVAHDNPGVETALADVDEPFLAALVAGAEGRLVRPEQLAAALAAAPTRTFVTRVADSWPIGRSPLLLAWLTAAASAHWVLRKLAGLSI